MREIDEIVDMFAFTAKSSVYASPPGEQLVNEQDGFTIPSSMHVSTRKKSSPREKGITDIAFLQETEEDLPDDDIIADASG